MLQNNPILAVMSTSKQRYNGACLCGARAVDKGDTMDNCFKSVKLTQNI